MSVAARVPNACASVTVRFMCLHVCMSVDVMFAIYV